MYGSASVPYQFRVLYRLWKMCEELSAGAITGAIKHPHQIDNNLCIKCGACKDNCNFNAVYVEM